MVPKMGTMKLDPKKERIKRDPKYENVEKNIWDSKQISDNKWLFCIT